MSVHDPMPVIRKRKALENVWNDRRYQELAKAKDDIERQMDRIYDEHFEKILKEEE